MRVNSTIHWIDFFDFDWFIQSHIPRDVSLKKSLWSELQELSADAIEVGFTSVAQSWGLWELQISNLMPAFLPFGFRGVHLSSWDGRAVVKLRFGLGTTGALQWANLFDGAVSKEKGSPVLQLRIWEDMRVFLVSIPWPLIELCTKPCPCLSVSH